MISGDTIAAISSTIAPSARIIVRLSGPLSHTIADSQFRPGHARGYLKVSDIQFPATVIRFTNPRSYTGEDLVEFHIPGNPVLARMLLDEIVRRGARQAEAGEFTARAYFNGRMDITETEGVAATIAATNQDELNAARKLMSGELARRVRPIMDRLADALALIEAGIDFTEEDISFISREEFDDRVLKEANEIDVILRESSRFERLDHQPTVALVGPPNAGKSTLLNVLAGKFRAVVSPVAGTTRDAISAEVQLRRGTARIIDVAGLETNLPHPSDVSPQAEIARKMHDRAIETAESADILVVAFPIHEVPQPFFIESRTPDLMVWTKADHFLPGQRGGAPGLIVVSAHTGFGMDLLRDKLNDVVFGAGEGPIGLALNARHVAELQSAFRCLLDATGANMKNRGGEIIAQELRGALDHLGQILGVVSPDEILGKVFAGFCIGK